MDGSSFLGFPFSGKAGPLIERIIFPISEGKQGKPEFKEKKLDCKT
jgi:hypothetical protein